MGVLLLVVTRSYIANSWIVTDYEEDDGEETLSFCFNIRAHLALVGQYVAPCAFLCGVTPGVFPKPAPQAAEQHWHLDAD